MTWKNQTHSLESKAKLATAIPNPDNTILVQAIHIHPALHQELPFHELQLPHLKLHRNLHPEVQRDSSGLLLRLQGLQQPGGVVRLSAQIHAQHGGVTVALVKLGEWAFTELSSGVENAEVAAALVVNSDLLVGVSGRDVDVERGGEAVVVVEVELSDSQGVDGVFRDFGAEN